MLLSTTFEEAVDLSKTFFWLKFSLRNWRTDQRRAKFFGNKSNQPKTMPSTKKPPPTTISERNDPSRRGCHQWPSTTPQIQWTRPTPKSTTSPYHPQSNLNQRHIVREIRKKGKPTFYRNNALPVCGLSTSTGKIDCVTSFYCFT